MATPSLSDASSSDECSHPDPLSHSSPTNALKHSGTSFPPSDNRQSNDTKDNAVTRMVIRSLTYFLYDGFSLTDFYKEYARIGKVVVELFVDEKFPPPHRADMPLSRKFKEFLVAPAVSSFAWFLVRRIGALHRQKSLGPRKAQQTFSVWPKAIWTVLHRLARQALIYRLFFRMGSLRYSLASALGIVCCFFKESLFPDILRFTKWPQHFSTSQGMAAILRSLMYAASFAIPLQKLSPLFEDMPRRRGNVKKLIFAVFLAQTQRITWFQRLFVSGQSWTI